MMKNVTQDFLVSILGAITSVVTAFILCFIERHYNVSIYTFMWLFIIPVGAIGSGLVASSGYYIGSVIFNHKPAKMMLLNIIVVSLISYFLIQYFEYTSLVVNGEKVSDAISFFKYWNLVTTSTNMQVGINSASNFNLGEFGYAYAFLQIVGFAIGGFIVFGYLCSKLYCDKCSLFFKNKGECSKYTGDSEKLKTFLSKASNLIQERNLNQVIELHETEAGERSFNSKVHHLKTNISVKMCKGCNIHYFGLDILKWNPGKKEWNKVNDLSIARLTDTQLKIKSPEFGVF